MVGTTPHRADNMEAINLMADNRGENLLRCNDYEKLQKIVTKCFKNIGRVQVYQIYVTFNI